MQTRRNLKNINPKNTKKSPIHENTNATITCNFGDDRCRIGRAQGDFSQILKTEFWGHVSYSSKEDIYAMIVFLLLVALIQSKCYIID